MKVIAYYPIHYAGAYFSESIKSIHGLVDKIIVFYSPKPSFGFSTEMQHPENMDEIRQMALNTSNKLEWVEVQPHNEGEHTSIIYDYSSGYDLILRADSDEVYDQQDLDRALKAAYSSNERNYGLSGFVNFYRSFDVMCLDGFTPIRIIKPSGIAGTTKVLNCTVWHFSCAQTELLTRYKLSIHGHRNEERAEWFQEKFIDFKKEVTQDLHLTSRGLWVQNKFDKNALPDILKAHPFFNLDIIK